jgi:predicted amidohydrolase
VRCHLVQLDIAWEDKPTNHRRVREMLGPEEVAHGDLVVLPEMFDTGFSLNVETTGADPQRSIDFLNALAGETGATVVGGITVIGPDGRGRNRAIVASPGDAEGAGGRVVSHYDKIHPFSFGREPERFSGGGEVVVFRWGGEGGLCVCPVICYDLRFPELFREGLVRGAEMFVVIANWPRDRAAHWRALLIARAIENQAWVVGVNRARPAPVVRGRINGGGARGRDPMRGGGGCPRGPCRGGSGGSGVVARAISGVARREAGYFRSRGAGLKVPYRERGIGKKFGLVGLNRVDRRRFAGTFAVLS